ncbi:MAG: DNA repair protein RadC [Clostridiales Family XIII bacterium]|jgi:DNA repair protein RadC|nr:DNA repair protein RadC [Clostridiales Family XIII bacterium]
MPMIRELPADERPREKLLAQGKESLSNTELLALLIGSGASGESAMSPAARVLAALEDGIGSLAACTPEELVQVKGIGTATAARILAAAEIGRRAAGAAGARREKMLGPEDIAGTYEARLCGERQECFYSVLLNVKGERIGDALIARGGLCGVGVDPGDVFRPAVKRGAWGVVLVHNHPSGHPEPSEEDVALTKRLRDAGELLGIKVLDHIVIGKGKYVSLKNRKLL